MIIKITALALCLSAIVDQAGAQGLSIELDGGLQGTQYQLKNGQNMLLPGGSLGLLYTFRLGQNWALLSGITAGVYRTQATLPDGVVFTNYQVDNAGSAFQYSMTTKGYKEKQQFFAGSIPLVLQYHTPGDGSQWYINFGGKAILPSSATVDLSAKQLTLSGYYPDYNIEVSNLPQHGLGTLNNWKGSTTAILKPGAALTAATGVSFRLSKGTRLYTGLYAEYGLTDLRSKNDSMPLVTYSPSGVNGAQVNSVLNTQNAGQLKTLSFGLQVRLSFGTPRAKAAPVQPAAKQELQNPADSALSDDDFLFLQKPVVFGVIDEISIPDIEKTHLDHVAEIMLQYSDIRISVVGHSCNSTAETENPGLGMARAKAVASYLRGKGIARSRMDISATNESDPVTPDNPNANFQKRRVVITVE
jgi:outer membrane protein OmpA-like peptidoglycan-associated protein